MHSPNEFAGTHVQPSQRANHFSFPPTQRSGLLVSTTRSNSQVVNLQRSLNDLLAALTPVTLQQVPAH